jgi:hypothetical protein
MDRGAALSQLPILLASTASIGRIHSPEEPAGGGHLPFHSPFTWRLP